MSESMNLQSDVKQKQTFAGPQYMGPTQITDYKPLETTNEIPDLDLNFTGTVSKDAMTEFRQERWSEESKERFFGPLFKDFFDIMPLDLREQAVEAVSRFGSTESRFKDEMTLFTERTHGSDSRVEEFRTTVLQKLEARRADLFGQQKNNSLELCRSSSGMTESQISLLIEIMNSISDTFDAYVMIFDRLGDILREDISEEEKDAVLSKLPSMVTDSHDMESATRYLEFIHTTKEVRNVSETAEEQIESEREEIARLESEKERILEKHIPERSEEELKVHYEGATLEEYVPKSALGKISTFKDFSSEKVEGVGKTKAFFDKKKLRGKALQTRMEKHVRRFLSARNGVSEEGIAKVSDVLVSSSGILADSKAVAKLDEKLKGRFELIGVLSQVHEGTAIRDVLIRTNAFLTGGPVSQNEVSLKSDFFKTHPRAAKVVAMSKLLSQIGDDELAGASEEMKGRIEALRSNISLLYNAVISSQEYKNELERQRLARIERSIADHNDSIAALRERESGKSEAERQKGEKVTEIRDLVQEEKDAVFEAQHLELLERERLLAEKADRIRKARETREGRIRLLSESIAKSREKSLADRTSVEVSGIFEEKTGPEAMAQGAEKYLETIVSDTVLKGYDASEQGMIGSRILENARQLCSAMGKSIENCSVAEIKQMGVYYQKRFENEDFKTGLASLKTGDDAYYRAYLFEKVFTGGKIMSHAEFIALKSNVVELSEGYLSHCRSYTVEKPVVLKIADFEHSTAGDKHLRAPARLRRMQTLQKAVKDHLGDNAPMSLYEYLKDQNFSIKTTEKDPADPKKLVVVQRDVSEVTDNELRAAYEGYLDSFFASVSMTGSLSFDGDVYEDKDAVKDLIKKRYGEYGATVSMQKVIETLGKSFNGVKNPEYLPALARAEIKAVREEEKRVKDAATVEGEKGKIAIIEGRLQNLKEGKDNRFARLIDVIVESPLFRMRLISDSDEEFSHHVSQMLPLCENVLKEMQGHVFFDQYLVERKTEIINYVINGSGADLKTTLKIDELDAKINETKVEETVDGKLVFTPFADYVKKAIGAHGDATEENALVGSVAVEILTEYGGSELLMTKFDEVSKRVLDNLRALDTAIERINFEADRESLGLKKETMRTSLHQLERGNMLRLSVADFKKDLEARLIEDVNEIYTEKEKTDYTAYVMKQIGSSIAAINKRKEAGEEAIKGFVAKADTLYAEAVAEKRDTTESKEKEAIKARFAEIKDKSSEFTSDPFLEPFYASALKMMTAYALKDDRRNVDRTVHSLYRMQALSIAADKYIDENAKLEGLSPDQRMLFKRGLFRYFGKRLVPHEQEEKSPAPEETRKHGHKRKTQKKKQTGDALLVHTHLKLETVEDCLKGIKDLLSDEKSINGVAMFDFITDGAFESVSSRQAVGETALQTDTREAFETQLAALAAEGKLVLPSGAEERVLLEYLLMKRTDESVMADVVALMAEGGNLESVTEDVSGTLLAYISGRSIAQSTGTIDYARIREHVTAHPEVLREELERVGTLQATREEQLEIPEEFSETDMKTVVTAMNKVRGITDNYKKELGSDILLSGREKLWRFYSVVRSYSGTLDVYRQFMLSRTKADPTHFVYDKLQDTYALLQAFFASGMEDERIALKVYGSDLCKELGIYPEIIDPALRLEAERKWETAQKGLTDYLGEATGESAVEHSTALLDREEAQYDAEIVENVKTVDRWLIENSGLWGDSESGHVLEIMSRPLRERLYIYYTIEHDMEESASGIDAAMAINVYVPDVKAITSNLKRRTKLIRNAAASVVKMIPGVKGKGYIDSYGLVKSAKVEGVMRRLDYEQSDVAGKLERMSEEKRVADRIALRARETNDPSYMAVAARDACYRQLLRAIEVQRDLLNKYGAKAAEKQACKDQIKKIADIARLLMAADADVATHFRDPEKLKRTAALPEAGEVEARETKETEFADRVEKVGDYTEQVSDLAEQIDPYDEEEEEYTYFLPWDLHETLSEFLGHVEGVCSGISTITSFIGAVVSIKETVENRKKLSASGKTDAIVDNIGDVNDFIESFADFLSYVAPATEEVASTVTGIAGAVVGVGTSLVKWVTSSVHYAGVIDAKEDSMKAAEALVQKQGEETEKTANGIDLKGAVERVAKLQERMTEAESINGAIDFTGAIFGSMGVIAPVLAPIFGSMQGAAEIVKAIHSFWANKDQREKTVDEFIDMDKLLEKYAELTADVSEADRLRLGDEKTLRTNLRRMALRHMHFSTMEEFFGDITTQYATLLYGQIFFEDGEPILASDTDKIEERAPFFKLFPGLKFTFPATASEKPALTIEDLAENLSREA